MAGDGGCVYESWHRARQIARQTERRCSSGYGFSDTCWSGFFVELLLNDNALLRGLKNAGNTLKSWGAGIAKIGAATMAAGGGILAPLALSVHKFAEVGTELQHAHEITGMSVKDLAGLKKLASESGIGFEELVVSLNKFQQNLASGKAAKALKDLGIAGADLNGKTMAEQLAIIADGFAKTEDPAVRAGAARDLFGRGARNFIAVLSRGGDAMRDYMDASKLWTEQDAENAQEFTRNERRLTQALDAVRISLGGAIVEAFGGYLKPIVSGAKAVAEWVREHRQIAVTAAVVGTALVGIGIAITTLGFVIIGAGTALTTFVSILGGIGSALAFIISPVGLVTVAIAALVGGMAYLATINEKTKPLLAELGQGFLALWGRVKEAWGGIADAIKAGDWGLAVKIGWLEIQREFWIGVGKLKTIWSDLVNAMHDRWSQFVVDVKREWRDITFQGDSLKDAREQRAADEAKAARHREDGVKDDQRVADINKKIAELTAEAKRKAAKAAETKPVDIKKNSEAAMMGIADAAKGTFSPYAVSQALAYSDRLGERIAQATEKTAQGVADLNAKADKPAAGGGPFRDDGG